MLAGLPLTFVAKRYNWSGAFLLLELVSLGYAALLLFLLNISSTMVPEKVKRN